jgi:hypothetical protein
MAMVYYGTSVRTTFSVGQHVLLVDPMFLLATVPQTGDLYVAPGGSNVPPSFVTPPSVIFENPWPYSGLTWSFELVVSTPATVSFGIFALRINRYGHYVGSTFATSASSAPVSAGSSSVLATIPASSAISSGNLDQESALAIRLSASAATAYTIHSLKITAPFTAPAAGSW